MDLKSSVLLGLCMLVVQIRPTTSLPAATSCLDRHQCPSEHYCSSSHYCMPCTDCSAYNRAASTECAQGILDCGDCYNGFIMGSTNPIGKCIEQSSEAPKVTTNGTPIYVWITLAIISLAVIGSIAFFVKLIKNKGLNLNGTTEIRVLSPTPRTFTEIPRPNGSIPTSVFGPAPTRGNMYVPLGPSSPEVHPPYEGYHQNLPQHKQYVEESNMGHITGQKESDLNQASTMLKPPCYDDVVESDEEANEALLRRDEETSEVLFQQEEEQSEELLLQEEETLASTWTQQQVDNNEASGPNFSNMLNEAQGFILIQQPTYDSDPDTPPRKIPRRQADNGRDSSDGPSSAGQRIPSIDQQPSLPALPTGSTQGSNSIMLPGETRIRHNTEDYSNIRPANTEIKNQNQSSNSNSSDTNNNNNDNNSSGGGPSIPGVQQPLQMANVYISFQQNNDIKVMNT